MNEHTYQVLGYHQLLDILSRYASCPLGQSDCLSLKPSNDSKFINHELSLVSEMRLLLKTEGFVSLSDLADVTPVLRKTSAQGSYLEPNELLFVLRLAEAGQQSKRLLRSKRSLCPLMYSLVSDLPGFDSLVERLKRTISLSGAVKDAASPALKKIREEKIRLRLDLEKKIESIQKRANLFDDKLGNFVTVRDGRYVIALRTDQKSRIEGIIHDYSQTRTTCFLEPVEVIQDNNRAAELAQEEKAEEQRILESLTGMVRDSAADLEYAQSLIGRLDGLYARAGFSEAMSCVMPEVGDNYGVELKGAENPLLLAMSIDSESKGENGSFPVPVDILLDANHNLLILSGPNGGGKTVTLKTLGLISLMAQAGLHIPAKEGSCLPVFDQIMADIGDDQDIQTGLSTFSAHAAHLRHIIEHTGQKSLVIIDEPGMGTDPDEGVALAMAVLDFLSRQRTFVAVSTHANRLKTYGMLNRRALNASVEFDDERNCPTFELKYGAPGISHALEVARDMGVHPDILDRARGYLDQDEVRLNRLIEKMNRLLVETGREKQEAEDAKRKYHAAVGKIADRLIKLEAEKEALMEGKRIEAEEAIKEAREELKQAVNLLKKKKEPVQALVAERYAETSRKLMSHFESEGQERPYSDLENIEIGQLVCHKKLNTRGIIQSVDLSAGRAAIMLGKVKISAKIQDLEVVKDAQESGLDESSTCVSWNINSSPSKELNVIGYRIDEAILLIDKAIDRALVDGELTLRIIHGFGTGRLRDMIRGHLKEIPFVKKICSADPRFGGDAITIVKF